jgi:hypothetical protein
MDGLAPGRRARDCQLCSGRWCRGGGVAVHEWYTNTRTGGGAGVAASREGATLHEAASPSASGLRCFSRKTALGGPFSSQNTLSNPGTSRQHCQGQASSCVDGSLARWLRRVAYTGDFMSSSVSHSTSISLMSSHRALTAQASYVMYRPESTGGVRGVPVGRCTSTPRTSVPRTRLGITHPPSGCAARGSRWLESRGHVIIALRGVLPLAVNMRLCPSPC